jgi:hypothetical protein
MKSDKIRPVVGRTYRVKVMDGALSMAAISHPGKVFTCTECGNYNYMRTNLAGYGAIWLDEIEEVPYFGEDDFEVV